MFKILKIKLLILVALGGVLLASCSKELDLSPGNAVSPDQINSSNIRFFLNGLYLRTFGERDDHFLNDLRGGNYTWTALSGNNSAYGQLITGNTLDDRSTFSSRIWGNSYKSIFNANVILEAAAKLGADASINAVKAETRYLRAYLYYQLVTTFGDVPLIVVNTTENVARTPKAQVWEQINNDLDFAIANGRTVKTTGSKTVSIEAAKALKARVLLALGQKADAARIAKQVIDETGIVINDNYGDIFRTAAAPETVFAFENLKSEKNLRFSALFWPYGTTWAGSYFVQPSDYVLNQLYADNDRRKAINIQRITNADGTFNTIVSKYWDVQPIIISRISEMYLICAEGFAQNEGLNYLNALRTKRGLAALTLSEAGSTDQFLDIILEERRRELFSEGFLFFDLVRTNKAAQLPNIKTAEKYVMPVPGAQISLSAGVLIQNQGY
ncbi:MAG: RagB/SusD family nutrient uptake outer membrane protein [Pedobacter sp.]|nr:MAG: RagB/SusD family nutrient uptake outer membrane protein [Pedobacter sp.]